MKAVPVDILLVEDNPMDVELTLNAIQKNNVTYRVHVVRDGAEALDFIFAKGSYRGRNLEDGPRVVLLDLQLPKVDGREVLRQIKGNLLTKSIPVVVLTSSIEQKDILESYQLGVNSYIVKPVDFTQFTDAVRQLGMYWLLLNQHAVTIDVECVKVESGEFGWNARFVVRGLQDPRTPRGTLSLTRLSTRPRVGLRYSLVLDTVAPSPDGERTSLPPMPTSDRSS
jgi:two-component system, response regulator